MGTARFMKTLRGRHKDGYVVIKLFIKPESGLNLSKQVKKLKGIFEYLLFFFNGEVDKSYSL